MIRLTFALVLFLLMCQSAHTQDAVKYPVGVVLSHNEYGEEIGAAVLLGNNSEELFFVTAAHVIDDAETFSIKLFKGLQQKGRTVQNNQALDIAIVACPIPGSGKIPDSFLMQKDKLNNSQRVIVVGHPLGTEWDINNNSNIKSTDFEFDERQFTIAAIGVTAGNSGGPVLSMKYELLGIVTEVNQVRAVCTGFSIILKMCQTWQIPINLMTGISIEEETEANPDDFRYKLLVQEGNTAFQQRKWKQAKEAYEYANKLSYSDEMKVKISKCEDEIIKEDNYAKMIAEAEKANDLKQALSYYRQAQQFKNTVDVRAKIEMIEVKLTQLDIPVSNANVLSSLPELMNDPVYGEMILVKSGTFVMGSDKTQNDNEYPPHKVYLPDYYIGKWEVTIEEYCVFLNAFEEEFPGLVEERREKYLASSINSKRSGRKNQYYPQDGYGNFPAKVSWYGADAYAKWISQKTGKIFRLPTEAEWEYAAIGGHKSTGHKVIPDNYELIKKNRYGEWYYNNPHPDKNELEIYYMMSSEFEWVNDWYDENYYETCLKQGIVSKPRGPECGSRRLLRGAGEEQNKDVGNDRTMQLLSWVNYSATYRKPVDYAAKAGFRIMLEPFTELHAVSDYFDNKLTLVSSGYYFKKNGGYPNIQYEPIKMNSFYISNAPITSDQWNEIIGWPYLDAKSCTASIVEDLSEYSEKEFITRLNKKSGKNYRFATQDELDYIGDSETFSTKGYRVVLDALIETTSAFNDPFTSKLVWVEGGKFAMGGDEALPLHVVELDGYYIANTEVTWKDWLTVIGNDTDVKGLCPSCPVTEVTWEETQFFFEKLNKLTNKNYRLPTEAEWEFAAKGGKKGQSDNFTYSGGNVASQVGNIAGVNKNVEAVGMKKPNQLGLYDMTGNAWEWCFDWYHPGYYQLSRLKNPAGFSIGELKVFRGGSASEIFDATPPNMLAVDYRNAGSANENYENLGFRVVLSNTTTPSVQEPKDIFSSQMVFIRGGTFEMGQNDPNVGGQIKSDNEQPAHKVSVKDFYIGMSEVSRGDWYQVMGYYPDFVKKCADERCPVTNVSMNEINDFLTALYWVTGKKYRLPSEAEWEYAAGGGATLDRTQFSGTNKLSELDAYANYCGKDCKVYYFGQSRKVKNDRDNYLDVFAPVGVFLPSSLGLHDMSGNVWEACSDYYHDNFWSAPTNGSAWLLGGNSTRYVIKGGSFKSFPEDTRIYTRSYFSGANEQTGFRLALDKN